MNNSRYSDAGLGLTKRYEGLRLKAYQDTGGVWTIGYGHTGREVTAGMMISPLEAEVYLRADLRRSIDAVNAAVTAPIEQRHFDALVDFCFNAGAGNLRRSSLLQRVNATQMDRAAEQFAVWINVNGQPCRGLVRRRAAETAMFLGNYRANSLA